MQGSPDFRRYAPHVHLHLRRQSTSTAAASTTTRNSPAPVATPKNYTRLAALRQTLRNEYPVNFPAAESTAAQPISPAAPSTRVAPTTAATPRLDALRSTLASPTDKPFSSFLTDRFKRQHNYLRISITERCNLRCLYCMPSEGIELSPASHLLSTNEIIEVARLFVSEGVTKIRLTGGEPTVRKDVVELVRRLGELRSLGLKEIAITSNGVSLLRKLPAMVEAGLTAVNLSLDTLIPAKFELITRRRGLEKVLQSMDEALRLGVRVKVNTVVMRGVNEEELGDFVEMTKDKEVEVRFIEYMPFDGNKWASKKMFPFQQMLNTITRQHPDFYLLPQLPNDTAKTYAIPGYAGTVGFITSMTENFCGTCNRLRITSDGNIKACLFGNEEVSLRDVMREYRQADEEVGAGGERRGEMEKRLLEVIGGAVGRKEEGHKPADALAREGGNRPMILIGG
ncbi:Similar to Molybdenum cofactor biosynthesis protein 1; acc. no. Q5RKZ7 [Pyronema omphalodes CBS 100304]|uniref:GTP 3',8-cyclase n=1 Tax=Pyronema omphalodes (strain CBS 100304) TaxID=1076935 RepID=U4L8X4_PYROM|nr:Similar to Molybdenum cofactor biosynthesis protein 1; acc. no. Q5RKZ7 [Pyronema omphalodes CBS 100304]